MTEQTFTADEMDELVEKYAKAATRPIIDASIRDIATKIQLETGYSPSTSIIWRSLYRIGAVANGRRWQWRHNPGKGG